MHSEKNKVFVVNDIRCSHHQQHLSSGLATTITEVVHLENLNTQNKTT